VFVVVVLTTAVATFFTEIFALAIAAALASVIVPERLAPATCALSGTESVRFNTQMVKTHSITFRFM
jgi:hypothetical protein